MTDPERRRQQLIDISRRQLLRSGSLGLGSIALSSLLQQELGAAEQSIAPEDPLAPKLPHFAPKAKNVIHMHMVGAPSQLDLFEPKPVLQKHDGQLCPKDFMEGKQFAFLRGRPKLMGSPYKFRKWGNSGMPISELLPHLGQVADEIALVRSLHTEQFNHAPAQLFWHTGFGRFGRPAMGSWITYGLGTENRNLPAYVVMNTGATAGAGNAAWGSGFLPTIYQGVEFRSKGDPVLFLSNPNGIGRDSRGRIVNSVNRLNERRMADVGDPEIATRISQYEMAFRMQTAVPDLMNISDEPDHIHQMYGTQPGQESFANNCLLARRLVERGVRYVQLMDSGWDHHGNIAGRLPKKCGEVDRPAAALIKDLKQRGLLEDTLVIWGGEFGRTPMLQSSSGTGRETKPGRDHHKEAFACWMAGGGIQGGTIYGSTDEMGYHITEQPMHVRDFHATVLHLLGLEHKDLTFRFQGREFRLTDIGGNVAHDLLA